MVSAQDRAAIDTVVDDQAMLLLHRKGDLEHLQAERG
jgi:hypothetical protein